MQIIEGQNTLNEMMAKVGADFNYRVYAYYHNGDIAGVLAGGHVVLTGPGGTFSGDTNMGGYFNITGLQPGNYSMSVTGSGMTDVNGNPAFTENITLTSGNNSGMVSLYYMS